MQLPSKSDLLQACQRIAGHVHRTPVMTSTTLNEECGCRIFFKCENFQRAGSFKIRGATNAVRNLSEPQARRGIVAHSSGNHAQAVALAAKNMGIQACIVMPHNAPFVKRQATTAYGGEIVDCEPSAEAREVRAETIRRQRGSTLIHPSNNLDVILGQGTTAVELLQEVPDLEFLLTPVGGGGLIAGCSLASHYLGNRCRTIGGEPAEADDAFRSLRSGKIEMNRTTHTICDGLKTNLGNINFPIIQKLVDQIITVDEDEIIEAMEWIWNRMKIIVEPSCAVPFAALRRNAAQFSGAKVGIILTGGNVDLQNLPFRNSCRN